MSALPAGHEVDEVLSGVHAIPASFEGVPLSVYVVEGNNLSLVDVGTSLTPSQHVLPALNRMGAQADDIDVVVNTHAHHDHFGGNAAMRAASPDVKIAAHHADAGWIEDNTRYIRGLYRSSFPGTWEPSAELEQRLLRLCGTDTAVDQLLYDNDVLDLGSGRSMRVLWSPAHSPGHILLHDETHEVMFTGDAVQGHGVPVDGRPWLFPYYMNVAQYRHSLKLIRHAAPRHICTAHFGVLSGQDVEDALIDAQVFADELHTFLYSTLRQCRALSLPRAVDTVSRSWPHYDPGLQMHATLNAHFNEMVREGAAVPRIEDGTKMWRPTRAV